MTSGEMLTHLYAMDPTGGWNEGMRQITGALLARAGAVNGPMLELGCGGGAQAAYLARAFALQPVYALDILPAAVTTAHERFADTITALQGDVNALPFGDATLRLIVGGDVIDQNGVDAVVALAEMHRVLRSDGWLLLRVSAHRWLTGPHDRAFNTARRYGRGEFAGLLAYAGFAVEWLTFANALLSPPLVMMRLLQRWGVLQWSAESYASDTANQAFRTMLELEAAWLRRRNLPFGVSLYALARKRTYGNERPAAQP